MKKNQIIPQNCVFSSVKRRFVPYTNDGIVKLYKLGNMTKLSYLKSSFAPGVDIMEISAANKKLGCAVAAEKTVEQRKAEAKRASVSRTISAINELALCNKWNCFATITLAPEKWNSRDDLEKIHTSFKWEIKRVRRIEVNGSRPYKNLKYLVVPELHKKGGIHLHILLSDFPGAEYIPYTLDEVHSDKPLPTDICKKVRGGVDIGHSSVWENKFGFNTIERITGVSRAASYISKYISKEILSISPFKSRYWCSRGLKRAELVEQFQIVNSPDSINKYRKVVCSIAAVTDKGEIKHYEHYVCSYKSPDNQILVGMTTWIDMAAYGVVTIMRDYFGLFDDK